MEAGTYWDVVSVDISISNQLGEADQIVGSHSVEKRRNLYHYHMVLKNIYGKDPLRDDLSVTPPPDKN